jgi:colicin import membrane protein
VKLGLALSSILHAAVLFMAFCAIDVCSLPSWAASDVSTGPSGGRVRVLLGLPIECAKPRLEPPPPDPIAVDTITPGELAKLRQGSRTAKLDDAQPKESPSTKEAPKEAPRPKPVAAEPPPLSPPAADPTPPEPEPPKVAEAPPPPPKPQEQPDKAALDKKLEALALEQAAAEAAAEQRRAEAAARAKAEAEAKAKAEADARRKAAEEKRRREREEQRRKEIAEKKKREQEAKARADAEAKSKSRIEPDRVAALLDKAEPKAAPAAAPPSESQSKAKGPVRGAPDGRDRVNSANEASMLLGMIVGKVKTCWNVQAGGEHASGQVPRVQFDLNRDGSVRGEPRVLNAQGSREFQLAADAAKRAILGCQNYDLPPEKYEIWKRVTLEFDPQEMFR